MRKNSYICKFFKSRKTKDKQINSKGIISNINTNQKGITLISLVVTIIVLLILAGVSAKLFLGEKGLITKAYKTAFLHDIRTYQETVEIYVTNKHAEDVNKNVSVNAGLKDQTPIKDVIPSLKKKYLGNEKRENQIIVENNVLYYNFDGTRESRKRVKWCFDLGIPVYLYSDYDEFEESNPDYRDPEVGNYENPKSEYKKVGNTYCYSPDLSNMNKEATYYVVYDGDTQKIAGRIDRVEPPSNWYDYGNKKWANVVTVNGLNVSYWVWIPRYRYKGDGSKQEADVKFVDLDNNSKNSNGSNATMDDSYKLPDAFKFSDKDLPGYWMSKYEVTNNEGETVIASIGTNSIYVSSATSSTDSYEVYLDGVKKYEGTLPHQFNNLSNYKMYDVFVAKNGKALFRNQIRIKNMKPDTSSLNKEATYYITYDENGNNPQIAGRLDKMRKPPSNWFDYTSKRWANIVTVTDSSVAYWVWIPRFKYKPVNSSQMSDIQFVGTEINNTNAGAGYKVPEAFTFNGVELPGYWFSKYEVSNTNSQSESINTAVGPSSITITSTGANSSTDSYNIFVNGDLKKTTSLPYTIENLKPNTEYDICVTNGVTFLERDKIKTKQIIVDISKFNKNCTYYLEYDSDGKMKGVTYDSNGKITGVDVSALTPISKKAPSDWYDYANKKWANVVTANNNRIAFWVWIPRYKYRTIDSIQKNGDSSATAVQMADVQFIDNTVTKDNCGTNYKVPEAFTFAGKELNGIWFSKYEVSN